MRKMGTVGWRRMAAPITIIQRWSPELQAGALPQDRSRSSNFTSGRGLSNCLEQRLAKVLKRAR